MPKPILNSKIVRRRSSIAVASTSSTDYIAQQSPIAIINNDQNGLPPLLNSNLNRTNKIGFSNGVLNNIQNKIYQCNNAEIKQKNFVNNNQSNYFNPEKKLVEKKQNYISEGRAIEPTNNNNKNDYQIFSDNRSAGNSNSIASSSSTSTTTSSLLINSVSTNESHNKSLTDSGYRSQHQTPRFSKINKETNKEMTNQLLKFNLPTLSNFNSINLGIY